MNNDFNRLHEYTPSAVLCTANFFLPGVKFFLEATRSPNSRPYIDQRNRCLYGVGTHGSKRILFRPSNAVDSQQQAS